MTYLTAAGSSDSGSIEGVDAGVVNINGGIGYNALLGNDNATRFSLEIGPRYSALARQRWTKCSMKAFFLHFAPLLRRDILAEWRARFSYSPSGQQYNPLDLFPAGQHVVCKISPTNVNALNRAFSG